MTEITKLIKGYEYQESITELAERFGIHRLTVAAPAAAARRGARRAGLALEEISAATRLYAGRWRGWVLGLELIPPLLGEHHGPPM
jgi:hypothetical protein